VSTSYDAAPVALRLLLLLVALLVAGCGGDDDEADAVATTQEAAATSCVAATSDIMAPVGGRVALEKADVRLRNGQLVESETPGTWFLSAELDGPGLEEDGNVATWVTTSRYGAGPIYSVDDLAMEYSSFSAIADAEGISADDPAAEKSRDCVSG
jgi:hypothetical protein